MAEVPCISKKPSYITRTGGTESYRTENFVEGTGRY